MIERTILEILVSIPKKWELFDRNQTSDWEKTIGLLVTAGLVERRETLQVSMIGEQTPVRSTIEFTTFEGLKQSLWPLLTIASEKWRDAFEQLTDCGRKFEVQFVGGVEFRLTDEGFIAIQDIADGKMRALIEFITRTGFFSGAPPAIGPGRSVGTKWLLAHDDRSGLQTRR